MTKEYVLVILAGLVRNYAHQKLLNGKYTDGRTLRYAVIGSCIILEQAQAQTVPKTGIAVRSMYLIAMVTVFSEEIVNKVSQEFALIVVSMGLFALKESK